MLKKCKSCHKVAQVKSDIGFFCIDCLADTIALALAIRQAAGEEDIKMEFHGKIDPAVFR